MVKSNWKDINIGDFFTAKSYDGVSEYYLFQKIDEKVSPYNAILLNTGEVCCINETDFKLFERVQVAFDIKPTE
jgi:hypothetical protein